MAAISRSGCASGMLESFSRPSGGMAMQALVEMKKVTKIYHSSQGEHLVLDGFDLEVFRGERLCLIGPSGSGKSTCLRIINALETIDGGEVKVSGLSYQGSGMPVHKLRQKTAMVFQRFELFPHLSVLDNVALAPRLTRGLTRAAARDRAAELLDRVGLKAHSHKYPVQLSGGQQQRVSIARALATEPEVLLCDEPTSALDPELVHEVTDILQDLALSGMTMLIVTHEMAFARRVSTQCLFLEGGKIVERSQPDAFFDSPQHPRLKNFLRRIDGGGKTPELTPR